MKKIRILLADDHSVVRMGLAALFASVPEFTVVGEAEDGEQAVRKAMDLSPDVILMDLMMPVKDGVSATREIHDALPRAHVVILTTFGSSDGIAHALQTGADGALMKSADNESLIDAIRRIADGEKVIADDIRAIMDNDPPVRKLSRRQLEIMNSIVRGLTNHDIAVQLGIREDSVKEHVNTLFSKLGAANRAEAVAIAIRKQLLKI